MAEQVRVGDSRSSPPIAAPGSGAAAIWSRAVETQRLAAQQHIAGKTTAEAPSARARTAAIDLVQAAIQEGRPELIAEACNAAGAEAFDDQLRSAGVNPYYVSATERILTSAKAGDAKGLAGVKSDVDALLKGGDLRYLNKNGWATPLWYAADAAERQVRSGRSFDPGAALNSPAGRKWVDGVGADAKPDASMIMPLLPGIAVDRMVTGAAHHVGNFGAFWSGPVEAPGGGVWTGTDGEGNRRVLYRNPLTGEDVWLDAQDPVNSLGEDGTAMAIASFAVTGGPLLRTRMPPLAALPRYGSLASALERMGPDAARAYVQGLRTAGAAEADHALTAMIAAPDTPTRQAALKAFGADYASLDLNAFRWPDGVLMAQTVDQRYALANALAQNPKLTAQQFAHAQDMAMLSDAVYPKVKSDPSQGPRGTVPPHYERVTDFSRDPRSQ
jgi:hypothetical protein